jgi:hypothetical protein
VFQIYSLSYSAVAARLVRFFYLIKGTAKKGPKLSKRKIEIFRRQKVNQFQGDHSLGMAWVF